jgi:hypothetical protein
VNASVGRTWDAVIEYFAEHSVPIRTIDRASGIIVTDPMRVNEDDAMKWADCGEDLLGYRVATQGAYNALVRGDSTTATIKITALWKTAKGMECFSKDVYERELETSIRTRAEHKSRGL